ncbi:MAG: hypothetical protein ACI9R3_004491 [Verrucomicrobiales bacterium]|jgi:uncharacterized protein (TIGR02597 family)
MKSHFIALVAFVVLGDQLVLAQSVSDTVGWVKLTSKMNGDLPFSIPFQRPHEYDGAVESISGNVVTLTNAAFDTNPDQFVYAPPQNDHFYLVIKNGLLNGTAYDVTANGAATVTVDQNHPTDDAATQGLAAGALVEIVPCWTLNTLLPNGQGLQPSSNVLAPVGLLQRRDPAAVGTNVPTTTSFLYHDGAQTTAGWYDANNLGGGLQNDMVLNSEVFFVLRNEGATDLPVILNGNVTVGGFATEVGILQNNVAQDNYVAVPLPYDLTLAESNLFESGVIDPSSNVLAPGDLLKAYNVDAIGGLNPPTTEVYLYHDGTQTGTAGWYNANNLGLGIQDSTKVLKAGQGFVVSKIAGLEGTDTWRVPPVSIGP